MPHPDHHDGPARPGHRRSDVAGAEVLRAVRALERELRRVREDLDELIDGIAVDEPARDPGTVGTPDLLTPAERRVLDLLASDLTRGQIAVKLYLSPNTVKTHVSRIYRAFAVSTREDAVAAARATGYLAPERSSAHEPCDEHRVTARIR